MTAAPEPAAPAEAPVTILAGCRGAGKTTLLAQIPMVSIGRAPPREALRAGFEARLAPA